MFRKLAVCLMLLTSCQMAAADGFFFGAVPFGGGGRSSSYSYSNYYHYQYSAPSYSAPAYSSGGYQRVPIYVRRAPVASPRVRTVTVVRRVVKAKPAPTVITNPCLTCPPVQQIQH